MVSNLALTFQHSRSNGLISEVSRYLLMQISRLSIAIKALCQLGFTQVALNLLYKFGLATGHYQRAIRPPAQVKSLRLIPILPQPDPQQVSLALGENGQRALLAEAAEIADSGQFRQFGAEPTPLRLAPTGPLAHWTAYETGKIDLGTPADDIKLVWEPARFGWAFILGRAYHLSQSEHYAAAFWRHFEAFNSANPAYLGPNWISGQEVGLRLMAWVWAAQIFARSEHSSPHRLAALASATAVHAARLPATLLYARSQNNNHLLTEAAALLTAGLALPGHPQSEQWVKTGRRWLSWCFTHQIDVNGEYVQHSTNYQRLMLQTALWVNAISAAAPASSVPRDIFPDPKARQQLAIATRWMLSRLDPPTGQVPNLGANDGALIFPFSSSDFSDYRPVAWAAARAFNPTSISNQKSQIPNPGAQNQDEMSLWFGLPLTSEQLGDQNPADGLIHTKNSWASLRAIQYTSRPSHADQLHCDLWWRGLNIAQDAGTYRYNAAPPWDNRLTSTLVHNTISVNAQDQMTRAGRFLYLDWPAAGFAEQASSSQRVCAQSAAYSRMRLGHERSLSVSPDERWLVEDTLVSTAPAGHQAPIRIYRLHWLLPDWEWKLDTIDSHPTLQLSSPLGWISLAISANQPLKRVGLLRAGKLLYGDGLLSPVFGWFSPTYNVKKPALSLAVEVKSYHNVSFTSKFIFPPIE